MKETGKDSKRNEIRECGGGESETERQRGKGKRQRGERKRKEKGERRNEGIRIMQYVIHKMYYHRIPNNVSYKMVHIDMIIKHSIVLTILLLAMYPLLELVIVVVYVSRIRNKKSNC